jgi:hypothetical protein
MTTHNTHTCHRFTVRLYERFCLFGQRRADILFLLISPGEHVVSAANGHKFSLEDQAGGRLYDI